MNKRLLIEKIVQQLTSELAGYEKSARSAHAEATDEQNKAENKYDTRALEASYLAHGQSRQMQETQQAIEAFQSLGTPSFSAADAVGLGALVDVEVDGDRSLYLMGPRAGGTEIMHGKKSVLVITPQSPLGGQLLGRKVGERLQIELGGRRRECRILAVS